MTFVYNFFKQDVRWLIVKSFVIFITYHVNRDQYIQSIKSSSQQQFQRTLNENSSCSGNINKCSDRDGSNYHRVVSMTYPLNLHWKIVIQILYMICKTNRGSVFWDAIITYQVETNSHAVCFTYVYICHHHRLHTLESISCTCHFWHTLCNICPCKSLWNGSRNMLFNAHI